MAGCITRDYKDILMNMISAKIGHEILTEVVNIIPICGGGASSESKSDPESIPGPKRHSPEPWDISPVYVDEDGQRTTFTSPSALVRHLGLPMSGTVCDPSGKSCRATSAIDILRISGYTVSGDGEPRKKSEGGTKLTVFHPDALKE